MRLAFAFLILTLVACGNEKKNPSSVENGGVVAAQDAERPLATRLDEAERQLATFCQMNAKPLTCAVESDLRYRLENRQEAIANYRRLAAAAGGAPDSQLRTRAARIAAEIAPVQDALARELVKTDARVAKQQALVTQINAQVECGVVAFERGQQMTFGREVGLPKDCSPLVPRDYGKAAKLLRELADLSVPGDAAAFRDKATAFENFGPDVAYIMNLRRQLLELGVVQIERGFVRVNHIGHPYGANDDTYLLRAYSFGVRRLARRWAGSNAVFDQCPQPICDSQIFKVAQAVTLKPAIDRGFLEKIDRVVAPSAHVLIAFSSLISANSPIRAAMGLEPISYSPQAFDSRLIDDDQVLVFPNVFATDHITLSIDKYSQKTAYPDVYPFFAMFQEARYVINALTRIQARNEIAAEVKDIRFEAADESGRMLALSQVPGGGYRLSLKVLDPATTLSIEATRQAVLAALPDFFANAREGIN